ncbi:RIP metalloprotease RseP [Glaciecola sp. 1036]|uniref:RIP metalloprotease RseP n=1 Tax=Alteromonadaceae TaxID=72275 RepID=UPI003D01E65F
MSIIQNIFFFILALSILVAVHEWGHYYVAKLCKVKIIRYSIGFGKPLYKRITSSGMEFVIAAIPLGGYVRMLDGRVDELEEQDKAVAFNFKPVWQRFAIVAAGPIVNFIFAIFAAMVIGLIGYQAQKPVVAEVAQGSYFYNAGVQPLDEIVQIGDTQTQTWRSVSMQMVTFSGEDVMPIKVKDDNGVERDLTVAINGWKIDPDGQNIFDAFGITAYRPQTSTTLYQVQENSPAGVAGLKAGDKIIAIDGTSLENWSQIVGLIEPRLNQNGVIQVERDNRTLEFDIKFAEHPDFPGRGYLGVIPYSEPWPEKYVHTVEYGFWGAFKYGVEETGRLVSVTFTMLGKLFTGDLSVKSLSGPISIAEGAGTSASYGLTEFLTFLALISVNLGIINLLPLPVLDGGHLMYFIVEWITGKPVSEAVQELGFRIGSVVLFAVMATAIFNDILRYI